MVLNSSSCRVLLVGNDIEANQRMADILITHGHIVLCAHQADAALDLIPTYDPEVVFVDFDMDDLDGYQVTAESKKWQMEPALVVALTDASDIDMRRRVKHSGFHLHIVKPTWLDSAIVLGKRPGGAAPLLH